MVGWPRDAMLYPKKGAGEQFTAKDFRTWAGTVLAVRELCAAGPGRNERESQEKDRACREAVAHRLGNRPATCRKYYVHPAILDAYSDGCLFSTMFSSMKKLAGETRAKAA